MNIGTPLTPAMWNVYANLIFCYFVFKFKARTGQADGQDT